MQFSVFQFIIFILLLSVSAKAAHLVDIVPSAENVSTLSWVDGPATLSTYRTDDSYLYWFRPDDAGLMLRSGQGAFRFDSVNLSMVSVETKAGRLDSRMQFHVRLQNGELWQARLKQPVSRGYDFPIRINESGNWFHHIAIYALELCRVNPDGSLNDVGTVAVDGSLEWRAWADSGSFVWDLREPAELEVESISATWEVGESKPLSVAGEKQQQGWSLVLPYTLSDSLPVIAETTSTPVTVALPEGGGYLEEQALTHSTEIRIEDIPWPSEAWGGDYPREYLDRISKLPLELSNPSNENLEIRLRFVHPPHPLTGCVPMLLDASGQQTGIPVQTSKNWHEKLGGKHDLPYDGEWVRTSTRVTVPAKSQLNLTYAIAYAQWQGLPAASVGQLSLVGWGGNGFWTQMALGSWGENFCFQPGRVLRRAMITDIRPTMQKGYVSGQNYSWTTNVGGGDVGMIQDSEGKYLAWVDAESKYLAGGPNRSEVLVEERLASDAARMKTNIILPRSNDFLRTSLRVRLDVHKPLHFKRFALVQMGNDYYNTAVGNALAYGYESSGPKVVDLPKRSKDSRRPAFTKELGKSGAWFSLFADLPEPNSPKGYAERGLIIREFKGRVGGKAIDTPWLLSYPVKDRSPNYNAELSIDPSIKRFEAGDYVEALVEWVALPPNAEEYYGANEDFRAQLAAKDRTWKLISEAAAEESGLQEFTYEQAKAGIVLNSGSGLANLAVSGMPPSSEGAWFEIVGGKSVPLGERFAEEAEPQWVWNPQSGAWICYLSVRSPSQIEGDSERKLILK
ncbi:hypothetical protein OAN72_00645 [bacterium]|nr:hypothetical protein [bacterium]